MADTTPPAAPLKTTPLFATHQSLGARLVDFGGWNMPVHYGSQIDEHTAVRTAAGMFDVSHMRVVDLTGDGARALLGLALANNIAKLQTPGKALYSCILNNDGGVRDDLIAYYFREDWFRLIVNAGTACEDFAWLQELAAHQLADGGTPVELKLRSDLALLAVQGPGARAKVASVLSEMRKITDSLAPFQAALAGDYMVARTGYTGEDGVEIACPANAVEALWHQLTAAGVRPCGLGARDTLRLEAGMHLYGQDLDADSTPLECGLDWTVDLASPRDFVGRRALLERQKRFQFAALILRSAGGVLRARQPVTTAAGTGITTSGTFSPTIGQSIALARLPLGTPVGERVKVAVRDKLLDAEVVKPPFVRHGKVLVS